VVTVDLSRLRLMGSVGVEAAAEIEELRARLRDAADGCVECARRKARLSEARRRARRSDKRFGGRVFDPSGRLR